MVIRFLRSCDTIHNFKGPKICFRPYIFRHPRDQEKMTSSPTQSPKDAYFSCNLPFQVLVVGFPWVDMPVSRGRDFSCTFISIAWALPGSVGNRAIAGNLRGHTWTQHEEELHPRISRTPKLPTSTILRRRSRLESAKVCVWCEHTRYLPFDLGTGFVCRSLSCATGACAWWYLFCVCGLPIIWYLKSCPCKNGRPAHSCRAMSVTG